MVQNRNKPFYGGIGSISTGTLRNQDLLSAMLSECDSLKLSRPERNSVRKIQARYDKCINGEFGEDDAYFTDETADWDRDALDTILNNHALPYFYFGAHPGDGADIGYWLSESFEDEFADCSTTFAKTNGAQIPANIKVNDLADVPKGFSGEVLHVNDHGNCTLYSASRGKLREV